MKRDDDKHAILFIAVFRYFLEHCVSCGGLCSVFEQKYVVRYTLIEYFRRISKEKWQNFEVTARFACLKDFFALTEDLCRVDWCIFFCKILYYIFFIKRSFNLVLLEEHILYYIKQLKKRYLHLFFQNFTLCNIIAAVLHVQQSQLNNTININQ